MSTHLNAAELTDALQSVQRDVDALIEDVGQRPRDEVVERLVATGHEMARIAAHAKEHFTTTERI